jgi:hypothetical protein
VYGEIMKITEKYRDLIAFMLIGDGYVDKNGSMSVLHCERQEDYVRWKAKLIKPLLTKSGVFYKQNGVNGAYMFRIKCSYYTKLLRRILYTPKKDITNRKLLDRLNSLGLAIWYMDDGGLSQKKRNGVVHANELMLNTHLTKSENQILIDYFKDKWNISFTQVKNKGWYRLRCGTKEARKFIKIVYPYVSQVPSMAHKLNVKK